ncbi:MAG: hypothetical protein IJ427_05940, partial [Lachnospiraceae bacterium]|nr:hypothetical protein [Lachnospiraceae bacterium]
GGFFYVCLLTKRKIECKQSYKKESEGQQILKIKFVSILHKLHLHSVRMKVNPPCNTIVRFARLANPWNTSSSKDRVRVRMYDESFLDVHIHRSSSYTLTLPSRML